LIEKSLPVVAAAALVLLARPGVANACPGCDWGHSSHPSGGDLQTAAERVARYNRLLPPGSMPLDPLGAPTRFAPDGGPQQVFLDFSQAVTGVFDQSERLQVRDGLADLYRGFDIDFSIEVPPGPHTRLSYDGNGLIGVALTGIDFRNVRVDDFGLVGTNGLQDLPSRQQINFAVNVGGHEIGHMLGLRHYDSFGPIGSGVPTGSLAGSLRPTFTGPVDAEDFFINTMSTPALGGNVDFFFQGRTSFSERSLIKMQFAAEGTLIPEQDAGNDSLGSAQPVGLSFLDVLNTRPAGTAVGDSGIPYLPVRAAALAGSFSSGDVQDVFAVEASAGDLLSVEVISNAIDQRISNTIDATVTLRDATGAILDYYSDTAFNDDEVETPDSWLFDVPVPDDGTYFIVVDTFSGLDTGDYELFVTSYGTGRIPGDANGDGQVDLSDFLILRRNFGQEARFSGGDFNGSLTVDLSDFLILRRNFGAGRPGSGQLDDFYQSVIPEPGVMSLAPLLLRRRR
jgi:hypothetical protein